MKDKIIIMVMLALVAALAYKTKENYDQEILVLSCHDALGTVPNVVSFNQHKACIDTINYMCTMAVDCIMVSEEELTSFCKRY